MDFVVTRAPFRISFAGGGTDLSSFYEREYGAVVSTTIDKYVYVMINRCRPIFDGGIDDPVRYKIRLSYSSTENVQTLDQLKHPIVREALRMLDMDIPMDIATMADIPSGNGLGSSGTFTVALLHALHLLKGDKVTAERLAAEAANIEINVLGRPVGKQDHYAAAYGGLNAINFMGDGEVKVRPIHTDNGLREKLFSSLLLLYTGMSRNASDVLAEQRDNTESILDELLIIREHAHELERLFENGFNLKNFGNILHGNWMRKRSLASRITNDQIDSWYDRAMDAGALGGKLCGAGGGGFLLLVVDPAKRSAVREVLGEMSELGFSYEAQGSQGLLPANQD